jgi:hypothetical protein
MYCILLFTGLDFLCQKHEGEVNASRQNDGNSCELPSFSNPSYQSLMPVTSHDNYVNMPQQKQGNFDNCRNLGESQIEKGNISDPSFISKNGPEQGLSDKTSPHLVTFGKNPANGMMCQNAFLNPNYQSQINQNIIPTYRLQLMIVIHLMLLGFAYLALEEISQSVYQQSGVCLTFF